MSSIAPTPSEPHRPSAPHSPHPQPVYPASLGLDRGFFKFRDACALAPFSEYPARTAAWPPFKSTRYSSTKRRSRGESCLPSLTRPSSTAMSQKAKGPARSAPGPLIERGDLIANRSRSVKKNPVHRARIFPRRSREEGFHYRDSEAMRCGVSRRSRNPSSHGLNVSVVKLLRLRRETNIALSW